MSYNLFLDDERDPPSDDRWWRIARSSQEAICFLHNYGVPDFISFDHDLGGDDTAIKYVNWIIESCLDLIDLGVDPELIRFPRDYFIHSQNPVGAKDIDQKMKHFINYLDKLA
jgi:Cyclic-phosphate processing Receiver domain